jgi:Methyltransferase domain
MKEKTNSYRNDTKSKAYRESERFLLKSMKKTSIPDTELLENLHLFISPQQMRRIFFLYEIYQKILTVPGCIMQFGVRWGRELALFESLRTTFEPFNHSRSIIGFDTFEGYEGIDEKDGSNIQIREGNLSTSTDYEKELEAILAAREQLSPLEHVKKFNVIKGNAEATLKDFLVENPHTIVSMAHLDMNIYRPTKTCLELLREHMPKGAIIIMDEVNLTALPGETIALKEVFGLNNIKLQRHPTVNPTWPTYFVID